MKKSGANPVQHGVAEARPSVRIPAQVDFGEEELHKFRRIRSVNGDA